MRLVSVPGRTTRPTADMVKEALFNMLAGRVEGASVLDLFAGSGGLGIEALSRGAHRAVFVERDRRAASVLRENLTKTRLLDRADIIVGDVFHVLKDPERLKGKFDLVLADPPYHRPLARQVAASLADTELLTEDAVVVVEHHRREELDPAPENIAQIQSRRYGDTVLTFFKGGA